MSAAAARVPIPGSVRRTIQNIREITGGHTDEEVYAMLRECSMDPNETTQRLLLQDTFHEVKRKRDKRKENNKEPADSRWKLGVNVRGGRGGRGNYSSCYIPHDAVGGRNVGFQKEVGINQSTEGGISSSSSSDFQDAENKTRSFLSRSADGMLNGPTKLEEYTSQFSEMKSATSVEKNTSMGSTNTRAAPHINVKGGMASGQPVLNADPFSASTTSASLSGVYASSSDPVLVPSRDTRTPGLVGAIKREVGSQRTTAEIVIEKVVSHDATGSELPLTKGEGCSESSSSHLHGNISSKGQDLEVNQFSDTSQALSSSFTSSSGSRPSSNYSSRSQQLTGSHKVVPSKEWKPKATSSSSAQFMYDIESETVGKLLPASSSSTSENNTSELQKQLKDLSFSDTQHVIIPNQLHVPESERTGLRFGSFGIDLGLTTSFVDGPSSEKSSMLFSNSSHEIEESGEEPSSSNEDSSQVAEEVGYPDQPESPKQVQAVQQSISSREPVSSSSISMAPESDKSELKEASTGESLQYLVTNTAPTYSAFGLVPQMLSSQYVPPENSEPQTQGSSHIPNFVQQTFDPAASYHSQIYRPNVDTEGRFSHFLAPGGAVNYNGNITVLSSQTGLSSKEGGNSLTLSPTSPGPTVTQAAGVVQSSIAVNQQPVPVFRQPNGLHISHYPPNFVSYGPYLPFYVQPPAFHHFLNNTAFPHQPPIGSIYPPPAAATTPVKYPVAQYKTGINAGNATQIAIPTGYGMYPSSSASYSPNSTVTSGKSTNNDEIAVSPYKDNHSYVKGQQTEGTAVWIPAPGREISPLPVAFYNLPPQGQHLSYGPAQAGHGAFTGIYHPNQTIIAGSALHSMFQQSQAMAGTIEMVGPPAGVYQQTQHAQVNWANNY